MTNGHFLSVSDKDHYNIHVSIQRDDDKVEEPYCE